MTRRRNATTACAGVFLGAIAAAAAAEPAEYALDPSHSFVHFELKHFGTSTIRGRFAPVTGRVTLDRAGASGSVAVSIATASVSTGWRVFDSRIREADLLASSDFPQASFTAGKFRFDGGQLVEVGGTFTLRGVSRPLSLRALHFACEWRALLEREVCGGDFEATIERSAFGAAFGLPFVADRVRIVIQAEAIRQ